MLINDSGVELGLLMKLSFMIGCMDLHENQKCVLHQTMNFQQAFDRVFAFDTQLF